MRGTKLATAVAIGMVALAGCSSQTGGTTAGSNAGASPAQGAGGDSKVVGIVSITANEAGNALAIRGATAAAEKAGWKVEVIDAQGDANKANGAMTAFAQRKVGMIFNLVFPATSIAAGLARAQKNGVPVATWGGGPGPGIVMWTGDGGDYAKLSAEAMVKDLKEKGSVLALNYHGGQVCIDREKAFNEVVKNYPNIKVRSEEVRIPGFLQDASRFTTSWLSSHPAGNEPLAIWGCWDDVTLSAVSALGQNHRTDVLTYGNAGSITGVTAIKGGKMTASAYEEGFKEGEAMFSTTIEAMKAGSSWQPKGVKVPGILITKDNVDEFSKTHADLLK